MELSFGYVKKLPYFSLLWFINCIYLQEIFLINMKTKNKNKRIRVIKFAVEI